MATTGRPRKTSEELKKSGAKPFKVAARLAEEQKAAGIALVQKREKRGMLLDEFIAQVKTERETFFDRLVPGQTVCKENGGVEFNWRPEHPLTVLRTYARQIADGSIVAGELTRRACARFLGDLENGASREIFIDPVAVQNIDIWFDKFGEPGLKLQPWELFIVGQILGWKRPTGLRRFRKAWLFNRVETKVSIATGLERLNCEGYGAIKHAYKPLPQSRNMPLRCESRTNSATRLVKWVGKVSGQRRKTRAAKTTLSMLDRSLEQSNQRGLRVEPQPS